MSALMSIGKTAMFASYAALQTTGNNIANANTPGYSRQSTLLADSPSQFSGAGFFGKGVDVKSITRAYNDYLTQQANATASTASADKARADQLVQLESIFPTDSSGIGPAASTFLNSFVDLANTPSDSSARQVVLSNATDLAARFRAAADQLSTLQAGVSQDVTAQVANVNSMANQVAQLNKQIALTNGSGQQPNQLLDQRDQLIKQIGEIVNVTTINADDGSVGLFIGGGQSLVLGSNVSTLKAVPDGFDPAKVQLAIQTGSGTALVPPSSLSGGSIAGLLRFQNSDLTAANNLVGQMAAAIGGAANRQQSLGLDLSTPSGAGAPMFSVGSPRVLGASGNGGTAAIGASFADTSKVQASDYLLQFDGSNYNLTRQSDNVSVGSFTPAALAAGVTVDGMTVSLASGTASAGDRFLIQPTATVAQTMGVALADPKGIAAASPFTGSAAVANTGTGTITSVVASNPAYDGTLSATVTFGAGNAYNWSLSDGTTGSGTWTAGQPITLNGFDMQLSGVPKSGDSFSVAPTTSVGSNNGNALAFSKMGDAAIVGIGSSTPGQTITDAYASALADIGVRVQGGKTASAISTAQATTAETARSNDSGVNLDEEAAKLIQFQQSYQAAAKILQVAQQIFDSMLQMAAG